MHLLSKWSYYFSLLLLLCFLFTTIHCMHFFSIEFIPLEVNHIDFISSLWNPVNKSLDHPVAIVVFVIVVTTTTAAFLCLHLENWIARLFYVQTYIHIHSFNCIEKYRYITGELLIWWCLEKTWMQQNIAEAAVLM